MRSQIVRQLRRLHSYRASDPIEEELRGWNYHMPPIKPRRYFSLSMSDVAYKYCLTKRDVYLRKVLKVQGEQKPALALGQAVHDVIKHVSDELAKLSASGLKPWDALEILFMKSRKVAREVCPQQFIKYCEEVYKAYALDILSDTSDSTSFLPVISEFKVDGSPLGLSPRLSVDAIVQLSFVVEFKVGSFQEFHKLALAGYALALESALELPIDFGALIYVNGINSSPEFKLEVNYISPDLRKEFLDARDEIIDMLSQEKDPGMPVTCSPSCPFLGYCRGSKK